MFFRSVDVFFLSISSVLHAIVHCVLSSTIGVILVSTAENYAKTQFFIVIFTGIIVSVGTNIVGKFIARTKNSKLVFLSFNRLSCLTRSIVLNL